MSQLHAKKTADSTEPDSANGLSSNPRQNNTNVLCMCVHVHACLCVHGDLFREKQTPTLTREKKSRSSLSHVDGSAAERTNLSGSRGSSHFLKTVLRSHKLGSPL